MDEVLPENIKDEVGDAQAHRSARLNYRQQRFVQEYLVDSNATAAYRRAGYRAKGHAAEASAHKLLRRAEVAAAISAGRTVICNRAELTQDIVVKGLWEEANRTGDGTSQSARVRAWELLGKLLGMFDEKVKHEHSGSISVIPELEDLRKLGHEELLRIHRRSLGLPPPGRN